MVSALSRYDIYPCGITLLPSVGGAHVG